MDPKLVEKLHEEASNAYLQGDVEGALSAWRQVLEGDPKDERAIEGVELCERMCGCESGSVVTDGQSPFAVGLKPETPESAESTEDLDQDLSDPLDELLDMGSPPTLPPTDPVAAAQEPPADEMADLLDFSDLRDEETNQDERDVFDVGALLRAPSGSLPAPEEDGIPESLFEEDPVPATSDPHAEPESTWHFGVGPEMPDPPPPEPIEEPKFVAPPPLVEPPAAETVEGPFVDPAPELGADEVAAANLHRRASELLATALAEMERGDRELALTTLDRLLILDEENEAARSLKEKLTVELEASVGVPDDVSAAFDRLDIDDRPDDPIDLGLDQAVEPEAESSPLSEPSLEPETAAEQADGPVAEPLPLDEPEPVTTELAPRRRKFTLPTIPVSKKILVPAAAVIVLGLGFVLWGTLFAGGESDTEPGASQVGLPKDPGPKTKPENNDTPPPLNTEPVKSREEQLAEFLQQADASLAEAEYAAAIVSFNAAIQLDPENSELLERLASAGESYRIQQAKQERWRQAERDFDQGDYRAALAYFYRLPEDEHTESVNRYMRNGWYNLGVMALKNHDCRGAVEHFREARRLDSTDAGVLQAADLAIRCTREGSTAIQTTLVGLSYRGREDSP